MLAIQYEVFFEVASHLSFTKAAEVLYISQPAVSKQIKKLEAELSIALFERSGNTINLTPSGEKLHQYLHQVKIIEKDVIQKIKGSGKFMTHVFQPQLIAGEVFKEKDQMSIYISVDSNQVPVLIESPLSVGKMKAVLMDYKGLRYPLTARLNTP